MLDRNKLYSIKVYEADPRKKAEFFNAMMEFKEICRNAGITQMDVLTSENTSLRDGTPLAILVLPIDEEPAKLFEPWEPRFKDVLQTFESYVVVVDPNLSLP